MPRYTDIGDESQSVLNSSDSLFHFTSKAVAIEKILHNSELLLGTFVSTNDPQEYKEKLSGVSGFGLSRELLSEALNIKDRVDEILLRNTAFTSFCMNTFDDSGYCLSPGYEKSRMWAQYGGNHDGICLVFSKSRIEECINGAFPEGSFIRMMGKIEYYDYFQGNDSFLEMNANEVIGRERDESALAYAEQNYRNLLGRKHSDYRDENEYRICLTDKTLSPNQDWLFSIEGCVSAVILGDRVSPAYYASINFLSQRSSRFPVYKLMWDHDGYILLNVSRST